eukprot:4085524-Amphidinium_carterae.1
MSAACSFILLKVSLWVFVKQFVRQSSSKLKLSSTIFVCRGRADYFMSMLQSEESEVVECPVRRRKGDNSIAGPPWLILTLDQGSVGWQATLWLYQKQGVQGWWTHDP